MVLLERSKLPFRIRPQVRWFGSGVLYFLDCNLAWRTEPAGLKHSEEVNMNLDLDDHLVIPAA
jgi:hypothetical protein